MFRSPDGFILWSLFNVVNSQGIFWFSAARLQVMQVNQLLYVVYSIELIYSKSLISVENTALINL